MRTENAFAKLMQRKRTAEVAQEGAKKSKNIRSGRSMGSPWAARGAGRWNDGGWRRRGEEVNLLWSWCRSCALSNTRPGAADLGATPSFHRLLSSPVALGDPLGTLGDPWGSLGGPLGTSWGLLGTLGDSSGTAWGPLGDLRERLGVPWARLGDPLGTTYQFFWTL